MLLFLTQEPPMTPGPCWGQFKHSLMADFLKVEGGRWMVDQFKHPLMVDGRWWMVIFEKN
jgi:hypothetical protein